MRTFGPGGRGCSGRGISYDWFYNMQWRIQHFHEMRVPNPPGRGGRQHKILPKFPKNCMKLKEFGPGGVPHAPLDPPLICDSQWRIKDSPEEDTNSWICGKNILWQDFSRKLHEGGVPSPPHDPLTEWCTHLLTSFSHLVGHTFF